MIEIAFQNPRRYRTFDLPALRDWLSRLTEELAPSESTLAVRLMDDREIRDLNARFRAQDRATDVLSFPGGDSADGRHLGDIAISVPTARAQAREIGVTEVAELKCLLLHGVLHCLGYDHETDHGEMRALEERLKRRWIPDVD